MKSNYIYILAGRSTRKHKLMFYIGKTNNILRRTLEHMFEKKSFGAKVQSVKLVYFEQFETDLLSLIPQYKGQEKTFKELFNYKTIFGETRKKW